MLYSVSTVFGRLHKRTIAPQVREVSWLPSYCSRSPGSYSTRWSSPSRASSSQSSTSWSPTSTFTEIRPRWASRTKCIYVVRKAILLLCTSRHVEPPIKGKRGFPQRWYTIQDTWGPLENIYSVILNYPIRSVYSKDRISGLQFCPMKTNRTGEETPYLSNVAT